MMKKTLALWIIVFIAGYRGHACINEYRTLLNGQVVMVDEPLQIPYYKELDVHALTLELESLDKQYKADKSLETLSDYGVILIYLGRLDEAIAIYHKIEKEHPNLYATAANIGTAHELRGNIDSAGYYIRKAITIDPESHEGSEWIHLKILEAKIKLRKDPDYLLHNSIVGVDFGNEGEPKDLKQRNLNELERHLRFQLGERLTFVKPPDQVVGQLLFDLGNTCALTTDVETALAIYEEAETYGYHADLMNLRMATLRPLALRATITDTAGSAITRHPWLFLLATLGFIVGAIWLIRIIIRKLRISKS
jgi:tetratricopeptide (TPR) repeat protein